MICPWNEFQSCTRDVFINLLEDTHFTDVTLACEDDKQLKAHKVILSACSTFFNKTLVRNPHDNLLIYLKGIRYKELEAIIKFIYLGQISIKEEDLESFMKAAKELQIKELLCNSLSNEEVQPNFNGASDNFLTNDSIIFNEPHNLESETNVSMVEGQLDELVEQFNQYRKEESDKIICDQCKYRANVPYTLKKHKETVTK